MRSGFREAILSIIRPSVRVSTSGVAPPSRSVAQGQVANGKPPYHSVTATGTMPSASR
ncbi:Uncharacterised protein [Mycobacteroides abscessus]|nr:Uncharacterised protein [Mycobacteroides abscessus]